MNSLDGMTQSKWNHMTPAQRDAVRDLSGLTPQLTGLEGWRIEVMTVEGKVRRFIVGKSNGWRPCHLEIHNRRSRGGVRADASYAQVHKLYKAR